MRQEHEGVDPRPMCKTIGWARLWPVAAARGAPLLRRGAWYPVIRQGVSDTVVLSIDKRNVTVPRYLLEIRKERPTRFTVVYRPEKDPNPVRGTVADLGSRYAVCPSSRSRVRLSARTVQLECRHCGHRGEVAWWETG